LRLIFIYGPPSVGKFTVGRELAELTGFGFFHNQLTVNAVRPIFADNDTRRGPLLKEWRLAGIRHAARAGKDLIFTLAYSGEVDDPWVDEVVETVSDEGGGTNFVQLYAPHETLFERVDNQTRGEMGKISGQEELRKSLESRDHYARVKHSSHLVIDTSASTPRQSAQRIVKHFGLTTSRTCAQQNGG
jgi:shikimate kinase